VEPEIASVRKAVRAAPRLSHRYVFMSDANESSTYILPKKVAAMQISCAEHGRTGSGILSELPEGAQVVVSGDGFNSRTMKVEWQSQSYFVFLQDIEAPDSV
jgi:hypothetical protein